MPSPTVPQKEGKKRHQEVPHVIDFRYKLSREQELGIWDYIYSRGSLRDLAKGMGISHETCRLMIAKYIRDGVKDKRIQIDPLPGSDIVNTKAP